MLVTHMYNLVNNVVKPENVLIFDRGRIIELDVRIKIQSTGYLSDGKINQHIGE